MTKALRVSREEVELDEVEERLFRVVSCWDRAHDGFPSDDKIARKMAITPSHLKEIEARVVAKVGEKAWAATFQAIFEAGPTNEASDVAKADVRDPNSMEMAALLGWQAERVLRSISDADITGASLRDRAYFLDKAIEKRALLRGEPTQILSVEDRRQLPELLRAIMKEAERRGLAFDVSVATGEVTPRQIGPGDR